MTQDKESIKISLKQSLLPGCKSALSSSLPVVILAVEKLHEVTERKEKRSTVMQLVHYHTAVYVHYLTSDVGCRWVRC